MGSGHTAHVGLCLHTRRLIGLFFFIDKHTMASPEPQNAETLFVWKAKHRYIISTFWVLFYLNQKEKKQKLVSAWIHVSLNPRAWARTQRASARGHQESSITEERNREQLMRQTWSWVRDEQSSFSSPSRFPAGNIISSPLKIKAP